MAHSHVEKKKGAATMSRDDRDQRGGHPSRYFITDKHHAKFAKHCRRSARARAKQALRNGIEPEPRYPIERVYYD